MEQFINDQIEILKKEMESLSDPYQKAHIRVLLITALSGLSAIGDISEQVVIESDKESIKEDKVKKTSKAKKEEIKEEAPKKETKTTKAKKEKEVKEEVVEPKEEVPAEEEKIDEPIPVDLDANAEEETVEPIIIETEEGDLDITEAYMKLKSIEDEDLRAEIAMNLTYYNLLPTYETLDKLSDGEMKMRLASFIQDYGLEEINAAISDLTDGQFTDIYEFVNDDNVEGIVSQLEEMASDGEEE